MKQVKLLLASWSRSFLAAALAVYLAGVTDPLAILNAGLVAILPVAVRYRNPSDAAFGRVKK